jgi:predicted permease
LASNLVLIAGVVIVAEWRRTPGRAVLTAGRALLANPLVLASLAGMAAAAVGLNLPRPVASLFDLLAAAAVPAALFAIGLSLAERAPAGGAETAWLCALKLGVQPAATWLLVRALGVADPLWAKGAIVLAGMPTGTLAYVVAQQYGASGRRASAAIFVSTILSVFSLGALLAWLGVG